MLAYLEEASNIIKLYEERTLSYSTYSQLRANLLTKYAFAIPTKESIEEIARYSPIVELCAGTGYWASLLSKEGCDIVSYDRGLWNSTWKQSYFKVEVGDETVLENCIDRSLFLCWPPHDNQISLNILKKYKGNYFIYVGEEGEDPDRKNFFSLLKKDFKLIKKVDIPQWPTFKDALFMYSRT